MTSPTSSASSDRPLADPATERELAAFIGPRWPVYRRKFAPFLAAPGFEPTWNWPAALAPFGTWFLYRKMPFAFLFVWLAPLVAQILIQGDQAATAEPDPLVMGLTLAIAVVAGGTGNFLLFRRAQAARRLVTARAVPAPEADELLARAGGVDRRAIWFGMALLVLSYLARYLVTTR